jgi:hypothetical protein
MLISPRRHRRSIFANCHRTDLAHPARRAFLTWNNDAERSLAGWRRLAILGVRQEDDAVGQFRVKLSQQNAARYPSIAMTSTVIATVSRIVAMPESSGRPPALSTSTNGVPE